MYLLNFQVDVNMFFNLALCLSNQDLPLSSSCFSENEILLVQQRKMGNFVNVTHFLKVGVLANEATGKELISKNIQATPIAQFQKNKRPNPKNGPKN